MGTTKTDTFGDYNPTQPRGDRCRDHVETALEEVGREEYFSSGSTVPEPGSAVRLNSELRDGRLVVLHDETAQSLGLLPVELNYLAICISSGLTYRGAIVFSAMTPVPAITVSLDAA